MIQMKIQNQNEYIGQISAAHAEIGRLKEETQKKVQQIEDQERRMVSEVQDKRRALHSLESQQN